jgi:hypothetical protein
MFYVKPCSAAPPAERLFAAPFGVDLRSSLRAAIRVEVLAALLVGERPRDLSPSDLQEVIDVQGRRFGSGKVGDG